MFIIKYLRVCAQVHTLEVFQKELNESEHLVFQAVHGLQRALQGDYRDVVNVKESSRQRLEALREAAIKVSSAQHSLSLRVSLCLLFILEVSNLFHRCEFLYIYHHCV